MFVPAAQIIGSDAKEGISGCPPYLRREGVFLVERAHVCAFRTDHWVGCIEGHRWMPSIPEKNGSLSCRAGACLCPRHRSLGRSLRRASVDALPTREERGSLLVGRAHVCARGTDHWVGRSGGHRWMPSLPEKRGGLSCRAGTCLCPPHRSLGQMRRRASVDALPTREERGSFL